MNLRKLLACASAYIEPSVEHAISVTYEACTSPYKGLPVPIRFRASGALQAWVKVLDTLPGLADARHALSDPSQSPNHATDELMRAMAAHLRASDDLAMEMRELIRGMLHISADMLCFWLRQGSLYEPTLPLGCLLGGVDVAADLPVALIQLPTPTLTILPPWQHRHLCGNAQAITIYQHTPVVQQAPAKRCLSIRCIEIDPNAGALLDKITLAVVNEQMPLSQALNQRFKGPMDQYSVQAFEGEDMGEWEDRWRKITEYAVKVLLYLQVQDAQVRWHTPHRDAPKVFPGLGRKKREAKLAEAERLYDRYVVGPVTLSDWAGEHVSELGAGGQLSPHWRRGHFRQQVHGPAHSLRKVMFIKPTLVRSDRLAEVQT